MCIEERREIRRRREVFTGIAQMKQRVKKYNCYLLQTWMKASMNCVWWIMHTTWNHSLMRERDDIGMNEGVCVISNKSALRQDWFISLAVNMQNESQQKKTNRDGDEGDEDALNDLKRWEQKNRMGERAMKKKKRVNNCEDTAPLLPPFGMIRVMCVCWAHDRDFYPASIISMNRICY